ncbi:hypothetical protein ABW21_db0207812 [Orbilia brochopaga]|nr:hypothetical protein ABW21_db0207812 [Drechslerella brochopaga]
MAPRASAFGSQVIDPYTICTRSLPKGHPEKPFVCVHCEFRRGEVIAGTRMPMLNHKEIYIALCGALYQTKDERSWGKVLVSQFVPEGAPDYQHATEIVSKWLDLCKWSGASHGLKDLPDGEGNRIYDGPGLFDPGSKIGRANFKLQRESLKPRQQHQDCEPLDEGQQDLGAQYGHGDGVSEYNEEDVHEEIDIEGVDTPGKRGLEHVGAGSRAATPEFIPGPATPSPVIRAPALTPASTIPTAPAPPTKELEKDQIALASDTTVVDMINDIIPTLARYGGEIRIMRDGTATIKFPRLGEVD